MTKVHLATTLTAFVLGFALPAFPQNVQDQNKPQNPEAVDPASPKGQGATADNPTKPSSSTQTQQKDKPSGTSSQTSDSPSTPGAPVTGEGQSGKPAQSQTETAQDKTTDGTGAGHDLCKVAPKHCKILKEDANVRVIDFKAKKGDKFPMHSHPAFVVYIVKAGKTRFTSVDGTTKEMASNDGEAQINEPVTHAQEHLEDSHVIIVEWKKLRIARQRDR